MSGDDAAAASERCGNPAAGTASRPPLPVGYRVEHCLGDGVAVVARLGGRLRVVEEALGTVVADRRLPR